MKTYSTLCFLTVPFAVLCLQGTYTNSASADVILDFRFGAEVIGVSDPYGLFATIAEGDEVLGSLRYGNEVSKENGDETFYYRHLPVMPGGVNQMSVSVGGLAINATQKIIAQTYHMEFDEDSIYGTDFQFLDGDLSLLDLAGLPSGYTVSSLEAYFGLFTTDPTLSPFPNLPTNLLPLSMYDSISTGGFILAAIRNAQGQFVDLSIVEFRLTSLTTVPEPSSGLLALAGLILASVRMRRCQVIVGVKKPMELSSGMA